LSSHPCENCGESDVRVLEFHHIGDKDMAVGAMVSGGYSVGGNETVINGKRTYNAGISM
jgi:hypothetical protein